MKKLASLITLGIGISLALPTLAVDSSTVATKVADFDNSVSDVKLLRHHFQAFAVMVNDENTIDVYRANRQGTNWSSIAANSPSIDKLPNDTEGIGELRVYNKSLHMIVDSEGGPEVWSIKLQKRPAAWKQTGDAGLGVNATDATHMFNQYVRPAKNNQVGKLIVAAVVDGKAQLVANENGNWTSIGDAGLGHGVERVTESARIWMDGEQYIVLGTNTGVMYKSHIDDLSTWEEFADAGAEITALRTHKGTMHVGTKTDEGVDYMTVAYGSTELTHPETDPYFSDADEITGFRTLYRGAALHALVRDTSAGASIARYNKAADEWVEVLGDGLGDPDNTAITSFIKYHGNRFVATNGENQIYRLTN